MRSLVAMLLLLSLLAHPASAQAPPPEAEKAAAKPSVPRFARTEVGTCGCAIYAPKGLVFDPPEKSPDGADVWTGSIGVDGWTYGAVVVKFPAPMDGDMEQLLISYMDFLKGQLSITKAVGVGRGHTHSENPAAKGVIDYWEDKDGDGWAVKGWVDNTRMAVMFIYGKGEYPWFSAQQMYLDSFRFK